MAMHSSILGWEISWAEKTGGLQSIGLQRTGHYLATPQTSLVAQLVKNPPATLETPVRLLGQEDPLEKEQAAHSGVLGLPWWLRRERICLQYKRPGFDPWIGKIPWRRERLPTPVFLPGEFHGQRSLAGYSPWGGKESDTTE